MDRRQEDLELVEKTLRGDREAFATLLRRHLRPAFGMALACTRSREDSEDVVQEAFLRAFRSLPRLRGGAFGPWLGGIVRHVAADHLRDAERRRALHRALEHHPAEASPPAQEGDLEREEATGFLRAALGSLPEDLRLPLVLFYFEGQSAPAVALRLGLRPATARKRLQLARDRLREQLLEKLGQELCALVPGSSLEKRVLASIAVLPLVWGSAQAGIRGVPGATSAHLTTGGILLMTAPKAAVLLALALSIVGGAGYLVTSSALKARERAAMSTTAFREAPSTAESTPRASPSASSAQSLERSIPLGAPLVGQVQDVGGAPAPGATVHAYRLKEGLGEIDWQLEHLAATADSSGHFRFEEMDAGPWALVASTPDHRGGVVPRVDVPARIAVVIGLPGGISCEGFILDAEGAPLGRAKVRIDPVNPCGLPRFPMQSEEFAAGGDGRFTLPAVSPGEYTISVEAPAHWDEQATISLPARRLLEMRLKPAACIRARVFLGDRNHPLKDGQVSLTYCNATGSGGIECTPWQDGEVISGPLAPGEHRVAFHREHFQPVPMQVELTLADPVKEVEVIFHEGLTVLGKVRNREDVPLPGLDLWWKRTGECDASAVACTTAADGEFEVQGLAAGVWTVSANGFASAQDRATTVVLREETRQEVDLTLCVPAPARILARDPAGRPVSGVEIGVEVHTPGKSGGYGVQVTNKQGLAFCSGIAREGTLELRVASDELGHAWAEIDLAQLPDPVVIVLEPLGTLAGIVLDAAGDPVEGAVVSLVGPSRVSELRTGSSGKWSVDLLRGDYRVTATCGRLGAAVLEKGAVEPARTTTLEQVLDSAGTIRGRLFGPGGSLVGNPHRNLNSTSPRVTAHSEARSPDGAHEAVVDAQGWYTAVVPPGRYTLTAGAPGLRQLYPCTGVAPGGPPLDLVLEAPPLRKIRGHVVDAGLPVEGAQVRYLTIDEQRRGYGVPGVTGLDGSFEIEDVVGDRISILGTGKGFSLALSAEFAVPAEGEVTGILVAVVDGLDLEVHARDPAGHPVPNAVVQLAWEDRGLVGAPGVTDVSGTCNLPRVPPGDLKIHAHSDDYRLVRVESLKWGPETGPVELVLVPVR